MSTSELLKHIEEKKYISKAKMSIFEKLYYNISQKTHSTKSYLVPKTSLKKIPYLHPYKMIMHPHLEQKNENNTIYLRPYNQTDQLYLLGHREKSFYLAQSTIFNALFDELNTNPNSTYITYANDLIKSGYNPQNLSVIKLSNSINQYNLQQVVSKILNHFQIPTTYYIDAFIFDKFNEKKLETLGVDFIGKDEEFMTLFEQENQSHNFYNNKLSNYIQLYDEISNEYYKKMTHKPVNIQKQTATNHKILSYMYLVRKYLINDNDLYTRNAGVLINSKTGEIKIAPAFDFEYCLHSTLNTNEIDYESSPMYYEMLDDLKYIKSTNPELLDTFISDYTNLIKPTLGRTKLRQIFKSSSIDVNRKILYENTLKENFKTINNAIKSIQQNPEPIEHELIGIDQ